MNEENEQSLSLRRAWIEIDYATVNVHVAEWSLSLRRAWIEIPTPLRKWLKTAVALLTESVD